jgi:hypothetical protein
VDVRSSRETGENKKKTSLSVVVHVRSSGEIGENKRKTSPSVAVVDVPLVIMVAFSPCSILFL